MVEVDLSDLRGIMQKRKLKAKSCFKKSKKYWVVDYRIGLTFGSTELQAFVIWEENVSKRCLHLVHSLT
jgi:hypothetical protein